MKVRTEKLREFLKDNSMTTADLAREMGVSVSEIEKMLDGQTVGINTARKFIRYFTAGEAQRLIDWDAIGKKNPLAGEADKDQPDGDGGEKDGDE
jgi:transcriptional regulator with XRE-family HTH domain